MSKVAVETIEQLDEMRARAMFSAAFEGYPTNERGETPKWGANDVSVWMIQDQLMKFARAIREADERAGLFTVPAEETLEMLNAAIAAEDHGGDGDTWAAKLLASPFAPTREGGA